MASCLNNSYVFGALSGAFVQMSIKESFNKEIPLYFSVACSIAIQKALHLIPLALSGAINKIEENAPLIDRAIAPLAISSSGFFLLAKQMTNPTETHWIDTTSKLAGLGTASLIAHPAITYISPVKSFFDSLNHPLTQHLSNSASNSLPAQSLNHILNSPSALLITGLAKATISYFLADFIGESIHNHIPKSLHIYALRVVSTAIIGGFLVADSNLLISKLFAQSVQGKPKEIAIPEHGSAKQDSKKFLNTSFEMPFDQSFFSREQGS